MAFVRLLRGLPRAEGKRGQSGLTSAPRVTGSLERTPLSVPDFPPVPHVAQGQRGLKGSS